VSSSSVRWIFPINTPNKANASNLEDAELAFASMMTSVNLAQSDENATRQTQSQSFGNDHDESDHNRHRTYNDQVNRRGLSFPISSEQATSTSNSSKCTILSITIATSGKNRNVIVSRCILEVVGNLYVSRPLCHLLVLFPLFVPNFK
jgi:hypothetical protein